MRGRQVALVVLIAVLAAGAAGGGVAYLVSRHSGSTTAASSTSQPPPPTTFTGSQWHTWGTQVEPVSNGLYKATTSGIKHCNAAYSPSTNQYARCVTLAFSGLAATIEQSEITTDSLLGGLRGNCRTQVAAYIGVIKALHSRITQLLAAIEARDYLKGQSLVRELDGVTLIDAASPAVDACHPLS